ncbi:MAG: HAD family hydrolase [Spirochaetaceae bacterium]
MTSYGDPSGARGLLFDIDGTLYDHPAYLASHTQVLVERLAMELGRSYDEVRHEVREVQDRLVAETGRRPSLANTFVEFGVSMEQNVAWRSRLLKPERYLGHDPRLVEALSALRKRFALAALTNNPADIGRRTLRILGVEAFFPAIVGLDDTLVSKPDPEPFRAGLALLEPSAGEVIMIGDRYDVDIAPALELGMCGVLVDGVEDVYALPETLAETG